MILFRPLPTAPKDAPIIFLKPQPEAPLAPPFKLAPGQTLLPGASLISQNAKFRFVFQTDGNLVLYHDGVAIWDAATQNQGGARLVMQTDGNLVLYRADGVPLWASATDGHAGVWFQVQDDGNAVVYAPPAAPLWETRTWGGYRHDESRGWLADAVSAIGRPFAAVASVAAQGFEDVEGWVGKIPIVGPAFHGLLLITAAPYEAIDQVIAGARIDRALIKSFRDQITGLREVGPYAQTVISFIPVVGQGVSGAIGMGLALADGKPLDEAVVTGIEGALPGGPTARAVFRLTVAAASGQNIVQAGGDAALDAIGVQGAARDALRSALNVAYRASQGDNIPVAALEEARGLLPSDETRQAFDVAVAVGEGKKLQDVVVSGVKNMTPGERDAIVGVGANLIAQTPVLRAAENSIGTLAVRGQASAQDGFQYGIGVMRHAGVNEKTLGMMRDGLAPAERLGFDTAVAAYKSAVTTRVPSNVDPTVAASYLVAKGIAGNPNPAIQKEAQKFFIVPSQPSAARAWTVAQARYAPRIGFITWLRRLVGL